MNLNKIQKKLDGDFNGAVRAQKSDFGVTLTGELPDWPAVVRAGMMCADRRSRYYVVNDIRCPDMPTPPSLPTLRDGALEGRRCDVLVVGAGITGCAVARELAKYRLDVLVVEKEYDVAIHASSRNDGMIHAGADIRNYTAKFKYNMAGNAMYPELCRELEVEFARNPQYVCISDKRLVFPAWLSLLYWRLKGVPGVTLMRKKELKSRLPMLDSGVECALVFNNVGRVCPYGMTIALAENAASNGVSFSFSTAVTGMDVENGEITAVHTNRGTVYPRLVVNAAGVFAEDVAAMGGDRFFSIHPRKGTDIILDKKATGSFDGVAARLGSVDKSRHSKGGGIVRTVGGNLLIGPSAQETFEREDFTTDPQITNEVFDKHRGLMPTMSRGDIITYYSGVRAATYEEDFVVGRGKRVANIVHAAGIQSPGLTAAPAVAAAVVDICAELLNAEKNPKFDPHRAAIPRPADMDEKQRDALVRENPDFGEIVCRCEQISRGEVIAALRRPIPCATVDGVKRRVRAGAGRCQGGFCSPLVVSAIAKELGIELCEVNKAGEGSRILFDENGGERDD